MARLKGSNNVTKQLKKAILDTQIEGVKQTDTVQFCNMP